MEEKIFMLLKVSIRTTHASFYDAIRELQTSEAEITAPKMSGCWELKSFP